MEPNAHWLPDGSLLTRRWSSELLADLKRWRGAASRYAAAIAVNTSAATRDELSIALEGAVRSFADQLCRELVGY